MKIAVSYLASNNYKKAIDKINNTSADFIHVDMCDGKYVETKNFEINELITLLKNAKKPLDIHLMVKNPLEYIDSLAILNVQAITIHLDSCNNVTEILRHIRGLGIKAGLAINPDQEAKMIFPYLDEIDQIIVMSVIPGKGGQPFIMDTIPKLDKINDLKQGKNIVIEVDGSVNDKTISLIKDKVDSVVSGSYVTNSDDYEHAICKLKD